MAQLSKIYLPNNKGSLFTRLRVYVFTHLYCSIQTQFYLLICSQEYALVLYIDANIGEFDV
jgi:hypothetical protein